MKEVIQCPSLVVVAGAYIAPDAAPIDGTCPRCTVTREKYMQNMLLSDHALKEAECLKHIGWGSGVIGMEDRIIAFGMFLHGEDYFGCCIKNYDARSETWYVNYGYYHYEWKHDPQCIESKPHGMGYKELFTPRQAPVVVIDWDNFSNERRFYHGRARI